MSYHQILRLLVVLCIALPTVPLLTAQPLISAGSATTANSQFAIVPVMISNASDVFAYQFDLTFDPAVLSLFSISEGDFLASAGTTIFVSGTIDNIAGTATGTADTLEGNIPGASGDGDLVVFRFQAMMPGSSTVALSNVILLDSSLNDIPFTTANGTVTVTASQVPEPAGLPWIGLLALAAGLLIKRLQTDRTAVRI